MLACQDFEWLQTYECKSGEEEWGGRRGRARYQAKPPLCPLYSQPADQGPQPLYNQPRNHKYPQCDERDRGKRKPLSEKSNISNRNPLSKRSNLFNKKDNRPKQRSVSAPRLDSGKQSNQTGKV